MNLIAIAAKTIKGINWKVRLKNKVWLLSMASLIISFVYSVLDALGVVPPIAQSRALEIVQGVLTLLALLGIIADPTTAGIIDSARALSYEEPWDDAAQFVVGEEETNG